MTLYLTILVSRSYRSGVLFLLVLGLIHWNMRPAAAQAEGEKVQAPHFRVGEKLSYNISFNKVPTAGTAELFIASRGKLAGRDVIEIRSRARTIDLVNAAFLTLDENRTVYVDPESGLPIYATKTSNVGIPKEIATNFVREPSTNYDIVSMIYRARETGGSGTFTFVEGSQVHTATFLPGAVTRVKTDAGFYDATVSSVQSDFFTLHGITGFEVLFSNDAAHIPVAFDFHIGRGLFRATLTAVALAEPDAAPLAVATPAMTPVAIAAKTPAPRPTPAATPKYVDNQPLAPELGFQLGEVLQYRLSQAGKPIGLITLNARERKLFQKADSLLLTATIVGVEPGVTVIHAGDGISAQVDPETLAPTWYEARFPGGLIGLNQTYTLDKQSGDVKLGNKSVDAPIGTHTILSLIYAMRSFNLRPSQDRSNPVNDTRVSVFWEAKPYVFTLRPSSGGEITTTDGRKIAAQLVSVKTENPDLDALNPKVWLGEDRVPLRFSIGTYVADLIRPTAGFGIK